MKLIIAHINKDGSANVCCPFCSIRKKINFQNFKDKKHKLISRCSCGERFEVQLNFRANYRKNVELPGKLRGLSHDASVWKEMVVCDVSSSGVGFKVNDNVSVKIGDELQVKFTISNGKNTVFEKRVCVKNIKENCLGCEFINLNAEEKELGFFLFA